MHTDIEDWKTGRYGIGIGLEPEEIDTFINLLNMIKNDHEQHFHLSSKYEDEGGVGDIEIYVKDQKLKNNMSLLAKALGPGEEIK